MKKNCNRKDGYRETIQKGLSGVSSLAGTMSAGTYSKEEAIQYLRKAMQEAEAIVVGAGAGMSTSAGLTYSGERFEKYFFDFAEKYGISDIYSGGFYPFPNAQIRWAWWARHIYFNRYVEPPKPVYRALLSLLEDKNYFVITTNVDHQFQRAGFAKERLFYTQGDYGLFQSVNPQTKRTYDNEAWVMKAMEAQGFVKKEDGVFRVPDTKAITMELPAAFIPRSPEDGSELTTNLRADYSFVEDEGWHRASEAYYNFLKANEKKRTLFLELGVGANTPVIIKYPFWQMTMENKHAVYACINYGEAFVPSEMKDRSICIDSDIRVVLNSVIGGICY